MSSYEVVDLTSDVEAPSPSRAVVIDNVVASPLPVRAAPLQPEPRVSLVKPWWHRLPHFVPVAVIEYGENGTGIDPRSGDVVYVDFLNQFSSCEHVRQQSRQSEDVRRQNGHWHYRPVRSFRQKNLKQERKSSVLAESGEWTTNTEGKHVFRTGDGKEYTGMRAYEMHAKIANKDRVKTE